jgi:ABC-type glutathione transport system ATPase component
MRTLVEVHGLVKEYARQGWLGGGGAVRAVDDVSFDIEAGEMFGLVGRPAGASCG